MDKIKLGLPRALYYYYDGIFLKYFFELLNFEVIVSPETNRRIIDDGNSISSDEMCLSLKTYLGHIVSLKGICDYIIIMRIDNYGIKNQMCTNFASLYDIVHNMFNVNIIDINIDERNKHTILSELINVGKKFKIKRKEIVNAYKIAKIKTNKYNKKLVIKNMNSLKKEGLKILIVSHPYNIYDRYIGYPIIKFLEDINISVIYSDLFNNTNKLSKVYSDNLYWKYSKESIGAIELVKDKIDGVIFISSFPCGPDSLTNELVMRKVNKPYLNLILDDVNSLTGTITRLESFVDILYVKK